ncbi:MAG: hypothetical protein WCT36_00600 [Candidatus Gracilibacteria bacterium]
MGSQSPTLPALPENTLSITASEPANTKTDREIIDEIDRLLMDTHDLDAFAVVLDNALKLADGISKPNKKQAVLGMLNDPSVLVMKYKAEFDFDIKAAYSALNYRSPGSLKMADSYIKKASDALERIRVEVATERLDQQIYDTAFDELKRLNSKRFDTTTQQEDISPDERDDAILLQIDRMLGYVPHLENLPQDIKYIQDQLIPKISNEKKRQAILKRINDPNIIIDIYMKEFEFYSQSLESCFSSKDVPRSGYLIKKLREIATQIPDKSKYAAALMKVNEFEERYVRLKESIGASPSSSAINEKSALTRKRIAFVLAGIGILMIAIAAAGSRAEKAKQAEASRSAAQLLPPENPINIPSIKDYIFTDTAFRNGELCAIYKSLDPKSNASEISIPLHVFSEK